MPKRRFFQIPLVILGCPFLLFAIFYAMRWVLTGRWIEGGGDRAVFGLLLGIILLVPVAISEVEA